MKQTPKQWYGLAAVLMLLALGWLWWQAGKAVPEKAKPSKPAQQRPPPPTQTRTASNSTAPSQAAAALPKTIQSPVAESKSAGTRPVPTETQVRSNSPSPETARSLSGFKTTSNTTAEAHGPAEGPTNHPPVYVTPLPEPATPETTPTNASPQAQPATAYPRPVQDLLEAQICLARQGISSGSIDGRIGTQTRAALRAFQQKEQLPLTGDLDAATREHLLLESPALSTYILTANDLDRLQPLSPTWLGKSHQSALDFETALELVAEKTQSHPNLIRKLNPGLAWNALTAGTAIKIPDVACPADSAKAAFIRIHLAAKTLEAFDTETNLLAHFPCSIARRVEKRPVGLLHVTVVAPRPNYTFDPEVFPESPEAQQIKTKLLLPPGPNNPVGLAWIGLDKPGYGIHGTPNPEQVGRTESHGCFRLANWNAEYLLRLVRVGTPVYVEP